MYTYTINVYNTHPTNTHSNTTVKLNSKQIDKQFLQITNIHQQPQPTVQQFEMPIKLKPKRKYTFY